MEIFPIKKVNAQSSTTSHPTIPFVPPGGSTTPTPTADPTEGPTIKLVTNKQDYALNEEGEIEIVIDTQNQAIDEFSVVVLFDSTHFDIIDSENTQVGIQIEYLDEHFISFSNTVEAGITIEGSNSTGRIQIVSEALNNEPTTISNRAIAKIRFQIKAQKTSELTIQQDDSNLLLNSVDVLDDTTLEPLEIRSGGTLTPTPSNIFPTNIPDTALDNPQSFALVGIGVFLVIAGVLLKNKIEERRKKHES